MDNRYWSCCMSIKSHVSCVLGRINDIILQTSNYGYRAEVILGFLRNENWQIVSKCLVPS